MAFTSRQDKSKSLVPPEFRTPTSYAMHSTIPLTSVTVTTSSNLRNADATLLEHLPFSSTKTNMEEFYPLEVSQNLSDIPEFSPSFTNYNNYPPLEKITLPSSTTGINSRALFLQVAADNFDVANGYQTIMVAFETHLDIYSLQIRNRTENLVFTQKKTEKPSRFITKKLQHCFGIKEFGSQIQCCALSQLSCSSSVTKALVYALAIFGSATLFVIINESTEISEVIDISKNKDLVLQIRSQNLCPVTHIAFNFPDDDGEQFLAFFDDGRVCNVVDIKNEICMAKFPLKSPGIAVSFHPSEKYKLMVAEMSGMVKFFNIAKQSTVQSINLNTRLICADWSYANPLLVSVGTVTECLLIDLTVPHCTPFAMKPFCQSNVHTIQFSKNDQSLMALLSKSEHKFKLFRTNTTVQVWVRYDSQVSALAWGVGVPYLFVVSCGSIHVYES